MKPNLTFEVKSTVDLKRPEVALRENEERYRTLFDLAPVAVYSCDVSGVIRDYNHRAAELWGRKPELGDTDERFCGSFKLYRPDGSFMPHEQCPMDDVLTGKVPETHDAEVHIERPDGSRIIVIVNIAPLKDDRGEITGAINCFYDVTERKQAEEALRESVTERRRVEEALRENEVQLRLANEKLGNRSPKAHRLPAASLSQTNAFTGRGAQENRTQSSRQFGTVFDEHKDEFGIAASFRCAEQRRSIVIRVGIGRAKHSRNSHVVVPVTSSHAGRGWVCLRSPLVH